MHKYLLQGRIIDIRYYPHEGEIQHGKASQGLHKATSESR